MTVLRTLLRFILFLLFAGGLICDTFAQTSSNPHGPIRFDCYSCHTTTSWQQLKRPMDFDHRETGFRLAGAHAATNCMTCHQSAKFANTGTACADCHTDIHQSAFGFDCANCHTADNWNSQIEIFETHASRGFALTGVHAIADCQSCHSQAGAGEFRGQSQECISCHTGDFARTENPDHVKAAFELQCVNCHEGVTVDWKRTNFEHTQEFELKGAHQLSDCNSCHQDTYIGTPKACINCHSGEFQSAISPPHAQFGFPTECQACHNESDWNEAQFDHLQASGFEIRGAHQGILCTDCHVNNQISGLPRECMGCHSNDFNSVSDPNHVQGGFPADCMVCHNDNAWEPATFDHNQSDFPLRGAHISVDCESCHSDGQYSTTPTDCISCHAEDFNGTQDPNHAQNNFSNNCLECHSDVSWEPATFDHNNTGFPLTGAHAPLNCLECHSDGYTSTPSDCISCHQQDFNGTTDPDHQANNFGTNCVVCHNTNAWEPANFDHNNTGFPLTGSHVPLDCISCHASGYTNTPSDCISCHQQDFNGTTDPDHQANNFSTNCLECHTTNAWEPSTFDHNQTGFPLTGSHVPLDCISCHAAGYTNTPTECVSCHQQDFNGTTDPDHQVNNFSTNCIVCHSTTAWEPANFDHNNTGFPLTGAHVPLDCIACHASGYTNTPADCISCHQQDFNDTTDPDHVANNFSTNCLECHTTTAWDPSNFNHSNTNFPLTGAHVPLDCIACHASGYTNTPSDCISCHQQDFNNTTDPDHVANNFSTNCLECHSTTAWDPAAFDHGNTGFPLTGAHTPLDCIACHASGYINTPSDCISCHQQDFNNTTDPDHVANNFSTNCLECHSTTAWDPAAFDHGNTGFPLTGAHTPLDCIACHAAGYTNTPSDCISCHQQDYNNTSNPDHQAAGFPADCESCHNTGNWNQTTWDHDGQYFPIYSGRHSNAWNDCADCHVNPNNFQVFECILCHEHRESAMANDHNNVPGYVWESQACLNCHPNGNGKLPGPQLNMFERLNRTGHSG